MSNEENKVKRFYIADTHFGHKNILRFDQRPWLDLTAMQDDMIKLWNDKVRGCDEVYIIGDFCFGRADDWLKLLSRLNGKKYLVKGNHDLRPMPEEVSKMFVEINNYMEVHDGDYQVILSHYPIISYKHDSNPGVVMLYGHVHTTIEFDALKEAVDVYREKSEKNSFSYQGRLYNCWCGFYGYAPATLEEILNNRYNH